MIWCQDNVDLRNKYCVKTHTHTHTKLRKPIAADIIRSIKLFLLFLGVRIGNNLIISLVHCNLSYFVLNRTYRTCVPSITLVIIDEVTQSVGSVPSFISLLKIQQGKNV